MTTLTLAPDLKLPLATATETTLIVGKRGGGKSNTAVALAEEFYRAQIPFAVLDPVDTWYGLKAGQDGKPEGGLGVYVFGGDHADVPLEPTAGAMMADVLVEHRISAVFVIRPFSNRQKAQFVADFAEQLFKRNRDVLHLFCEEAHEVMPQQPYKGEEEMLGRMLKLQKLGRSSGIGLTSITQRPASLNKNATTQAEILIAHRLLGPQDIAAVEAWIKHHHVEDQKAEVLAGLPHLKTGEAWIWAPDFPEDAPIGLRQVKFRQAHTFDSRRTPKPGERRTEVKALAPVDLEKLRTKMAATIEKAKAEDPRALRGRIAELERELHVAKKATGLHSASVKEKRVEVPVLSDQQLTRIEKIVGHLEGLSDKLDSHTCILSAALREVAEAAKRDRAAKPVPALPVQRPLGGDYRTESGVTLPRRVHASVQTSARPEAHGGQVVGDLSGPEQRILDELAELQGMGIAPAEKAQLALLCGYTNAKSGGFAEPMGRLRARGLLSYTGAAQVALTAEGLAQARPVSTPASTQELQQRILAKLDGPRARILREVIAAYPQALDKHELGQKLGYSNPKSGGYAEPLGSLRALGLIDYPGPGQVKARPALFLER